MRISFISFQLLLLVVSAVLFTAGAQEPGYDSSLFSISLNELKNVVVTPSKLPQVSGNVTQKIDVITKKSIEHCVSGSGNICETLRRLPGFSVSVLSRNDANWGTYGGIGPKYCTYMIQGVPVDGFIEPMSLDYAPIERVEVQHGPASIFYPNFLSQDFAGSQSPLAGTVNMILKDRIDQPATSLMLSAGTYNTLNGRLYHQNNSGLLNYFCGTSLETSQYTNYGSDNSWLDIRNNPDYRKIKIYAGLTMFADESENSKISLFVHSTNHTGSRGRENLDYDHRYTIINTGFSSVLGEYFTLQANYGLRLYDRVWNESTAGAADTFKSKNGVTQQIVPVDIALSWKHIENSYLSVGADYQNAVYSTWSDPMAARRIYGNKSNSSQTGIYIQEEFNPARSVVLRGGLRWARISHDISLINSAAYSLGANKWDKVLWSFGARYLINGSASVYGNCGNSFLPPSVKSLGGTISAGDRGIPGRDGQLPNPSLIPENGIGADLGAELFLFGAIECGIRLFYNSINDAIVENVVSRKPSQSQSLNAGQTLASGGELTLSCSLFETGTVYSAFSFMTTKVENDSDPNQDNVDIPFAPKFTANLGAEVRLPMGIKAAPEINYNNGFYDGAFKDIRKFFRQGFLVNLFLSRYLYNSYTGSTEVFLKLYNLTNNRYEMPWQFRNTGLAVEAGIKAVIF